MVVWNSAKAKVSTQHSLYIKEIWLICLQDNVLGSITVIIHLFGSLLRLISFRSLSIQRLRTLQQKKEAQAKASRREIATLVERSKTETARIKVESRMCSYHAA